MAISLADKYGGSGFAPGQVALGDPGYPYGRPQNVVVPGDGIGTPLEETWMKDLHGFLQSLLVATDQTPSGTPDQVGASQYLSAIATLISSAASPLSTRISAIENALFRPALFSVAQGQTRAYAESLSLTELQDPASTYSYGGGKIQVAAPGWYLVHVNVHCTGTTKTGDFVQFGVRVEKDDGGTRADLFGLYANGSQPVISGSHLFNIAAPSTQKIFVTASPDISETSTYGAGLVTITRVK